ncbi:uncharacterized protein LOC117659200 [Pantherophis guttatus]|uniref:Uncharacterized protein LOC117659200 n=1 Tax=Pantherophis guttatus TaxID=94885 RepID=A0ABM3YY70_PANGU|nr:uncharacterized protein LOC117659200 [Pantherophis guttatus]XP_060541071.1 uncharacterized protein LOC117659200 [Pantherophis guttatus]
MEPPEAADGHEETVSGEGLNPPAPKPRGPKKGPATPKTVTTRAAARIRAKALPSSRKAPKAKEEEEEEEQKALGGEEEAAKAEGGEGEQGGQESPLVDEPKHSQASQPQPLQPLTKEVGQTASPVQSPDGAGEQLSDPTLPMIEQDELSSLPSVSNLPPETPWEEPAAKRAKITPEATSTPAVAGLRPKETQEPEKSLPKETQHPQITPRMRLMISEAIARGIAAGMQQNQQAASDHTPHEGQPPAPDNPRDVAALPRPLSPAPSIHSQESLLDDEEPQGSMVSEDKGGTTDTLAFTGLFNPALFKTLLHRAKATARIEDSSASDPASGLSDPNSLVFSEPTIDNEEIPSPKLFLDVIQQQWDQPGRYPGQSMTDKQFYNVAPNLTAALEMPTIDKPVAALACADIITNNLDEALNAEDRRAEVSLRKAYNSAAWAIKAATAASFFNRTSVLWLKEMQARIPATDLQAHQALNNLVMAAEYSADATLNSAKFASIFHLLFCDRPTAAVAPLLAGNRKVQVEVGHSPLQRGQPIRRGLRACAHRDGRQKEGPTLYVQTPRPAV